MKKPKINLKIKMPKSNYKPDKFTLSLVLIFIALVASVYLGGVSKSKNQKMEAEKITEIILDNHRISFASNGIIDEKKLREVQEMSYESFKKSLQASKDFCILIEDEKGNILLSKGSSKLNNNGIYCRE